MKTYDISALGNLNTVLNYICHQNLFAQIESVSTKLKDVMLRVQVTKFLFSFEYNFFHPIPIPIA